MGVLELRLAGVCFPGPGDKTLTPGLRPTLSVTISEKEIIAKPLPSLSNRLTMIKYVSDKVLNI